MYGKELILDLHDCAHLPATREQLTKFFDDLCQKIDMQQEDLHFWDYEGDEQAYKDAPPHLQGISAVQFIQTSNVTVHAVDGLNKVFINVFSCKDFDSTVAKSVALEFFGGKAVNQVDINRL